jgi:hypothetical protein
MRACVGRNDVVLQNEQTRDRALEASKLAPQFGQARTWRPVGLCWTRTSVWPCRCSSATTATADGAEWTSSAGSV